VSPLQPLTCAQPVIPGLIYAVERAEDVFQLGIRHSGSCVTNTNAYMLCPIGSHSNSYLRMRVCVFDSIPYSIFDSAVEKVGISENS